MHLTWFPNGACLDFTHSKNARSASSPTVLCTHKPMAVA